MRFLDSIPSESKKVGFLILKKRNYRREKRKWDVLERKFENASIRLLGIRNILDFLK
jgi:hypothetical protein